MSVGTRRSGAVLAAGLLAAGLAGCGDDAPSVTSGSQTSSAAPSSPAPSSAAPSDSSASATSPDTAATPSASSPASAKVDGTRSNRVKLCDAGDADTTNNVCKTNSSDISGNIVYCSADLPSSVKGSVRATLYRNGAPVYEGSINRTSTVGSLFLNFSVGELKLAGGDYACKFESGGKTWVGETKVSGPQGRASQGMACDSATMYSKEQVTHCTSNTKTLSAPSGLGCSALLTDLMGRKIDATLRTPSGTKDVPLSSSFASGSAVVHIKAPKSAFGGTFPKGAYTCEFKVDDKPVISVPFNVS